MNRVTVPGASFLAIMTSLTGGVSANASQSEPDFAQRCAALPRAMQGQSSGSGVRIASSTYHESGTAYSLPAWPGSPPVTIKLPAHCEVAAVLRERTGSDGKPYAINMRVRLPEGWNGRFLMQGGSGTNGMVGDALGMTGFGQPFALEKGFAVLSQDSGHDNATNFDPARGGATAFGFEPEARAQYGGTSLPLVTRIAKDLVRAVYGKVPDYSYFMGCSKGGQEGMMLAQRYPELYDGIVAAAPGFSLPRAAVAEMWNTQALVSTIPAKLGGFTPDDLSRSFSPAQLGLVRDAVLKACDGSDGLRDGIVANYRICTTDRVLPELKKRMCKAGGKGECLSRPQVNALLRIHTGARDSKGRQIYPGFPWDAGWADVGWQIWMMGTPDGKVPALNVAMGSAALSTIFSVPARPIGPTPQDGLNFALAYNFDRDAPGIYHIAPPFERSAWQDIGARSADLAAFQARGGKLIVPHGVSDPVFSINDTMTWWSEVNRSAKGKAADFARVFPVPGMAHCAGGPATDNYDALSALMDWVEKGQAPDALAAHAGPNTPWPGRQRPVCRYPLIARTTVGQSGVESTRCVSS